MVQPHEIIYELTLEKLHYIYPITVFIKFIGPKRKRYILAAINALNGKPIDIGIVLKRAPQLDQAIESLKWAVENDPQPVHPDIARFIKSV